MIVLDLDLDFFVSGIVDNAADFRVSEGKIYSWDIDRFCDFLESKCKLSKNSRAKGCMVKKHHGCYLAWRELVQKADLKIPFDVIHVDAHSDFGLGSSSWTEVVFDLLHREVRDRAYPSKLNEGNYLTYAIANRWIKEISFVQHPNWEMDYMQIYMKDFNDFSGYIELKGYEKQSVLDYPSLFKIKPKVVETAVKLNELTEKEFRLETKPDYVFISQSPSYTPQSADRLLDVFKEYIEEIVFDGDVLKI
ncbi:hypothetical protein SANA_20240 [Gottschalkiaceae bacterium SANA]|nr:hypothetical protein SANA_20240 [Gottschalkiaceae bacterium SANA]